MQTAIEVAALGSERRQGRGAYPGDLAETERDVGRVGDFHPDPRQLRARRTQQVGHDEHRTPAHRSGEQVHQGRAGGDGLAPVVGGTGLVGRRRADKREPFNARHVVEGGTAVIAAGQFLLVERGQGPQTAGFREEEVTFVVRAVAAEHRFRLAVDGTLVDPRGEDGIIGAARSQPPARGLQPRGVRGRGVHRQNTARTNVQLRELLQSHWDSLVVKPLPPR